MIGSACREGGHILIETCPQFGMIHMKTNNDYAAIRLNEPAK